MPLDATNIKKSFLIKFVIHVTEKMERAGPDVPKFSALRMWWIRFRLRYFLLLQLSQFGCQFNIWTGSFVSFELKVKKFVG